MKIANATILITGANRGIGQALVVEALERGARKVYAGMRCPVPVSDHRVTPLKLDVTNREHIQRAAEEIDQLDVLVNNAGIAIPDDLSNSAIIEQHLAVNFFGPLNMINAFLPHLKRSSGAVINNLSLLALAAIPMVPSYSISKAAAFNMSQSLRALVKNDGVTIHSVMLGPIDTDMSRSLEVPKASPNSAAAGIFDGLEKGEDEIFPDPMAGSITEGWQNGVVKALERQFAAFVPPVVATPA